MSADEYQNAYEQRLALVRTPLRRRRALYALIALIAVILIEILVIPCARAYGGFHGVVLVLFPVGLGAMVVPFLLTYTSHPHMPGKMR
jgi:hypothetical protein